MAARFKALGHATNTIPKALGFAITSDPINLKYSLYF